MSKLSPRKSSQMLILYLQTLHCWSSPQSSHQHAWGHQHLSKSNICVTELILTYSDSLHKWRWHVALFRSVQPSPELRYCEILIRFSIRLTYRIPSILRQSSWARFKRHDASLGLPPPSACSAEVFLKSNAMSHASCICSDSPGSISQNQTHHLWMIYWMKNDQSPWMSMDGMVWYGVDTWYANHVPSLSMVFVIAVLP